MKIVTRSQAKTLGVPRYFTGAACLRGHVAERFTAGGNCTECRREQVRERYTDDPEFREHERKRHREWWREHRAAAA
jgi:hypothetical protein